MATHEAASVSEQHLSLLYLKCDGVVMRRAASVIYTFHPPLSELFITNLPETSRFVATWGKTITGVLDVRHPTEDGSFIAFKPSIRTYRAI